MIEPAEASAFRPLAAWMTAQGTVKAQPHGPRGELARQIGSSADRLTEIKAPPPPPPPG